MLAPHPPCTDPSLEVHLGAWCVLFFFQHNTSPIAGEKQTHSAVDLSVPTMPATVDCEGGAVSWHTASVEQCHATNVSLWKVTALMHEINYMYYQEKMIKRANRPEG